MSSVDRKPHMNPLYLSASKVFLDVQVQANERKHYGDGLCVFISMLGRIRIDDMLMEKRRIRMGQGIEGKLVIQILV